MKALKHVNSKCGIEYRYLQCEIFKAFLNIFFSFSTTFKKETFMLLCKSHALFSSYNPLFILESFTQSDKLAQMSYSCMFRNYSITKLTLSTLFPTKILIHSWLVEYRSTSFAHRFDKFVKVSRLVTSYTNIKIKWWLISQILALHESSLSIANKNHSIKVQLNQ